LPSEPSPATRIVGVLLAAGRGARFGGDKLLAPLAHPAAGVPAGTPLGVAAARHLVDALPDSVAVIRRGDSSLRTLLEATGIVIVECANAGDGMGASLACGVRACAAADGFVVALADMPWISVVTIAAIADALRAGADLAAPVHRGVRGHPVGFSRRHRDALVALAADAGAREILDAHARSLTRVEVDDDGIVRDVDTKAALLRPT
jgi:molybdenum cofactor cytidylyltransferase